MDKNSFAPTPPMGWNSWDCYGASVTEVAIRGNAEYMAKHLSAYGWEYVVCDIQWYEPEAKGTEYNNFYPLCMDGYSRLVPAENRFPSAAGGRGFAPLAEYIHSLGLKFGIHCMRGIPRQAVHAASPILGSAATARDIAHPSSLCPWNTDMYGVNPDAEGAQEYYNSLLALYASWGVDYVKVDDIASTRQHPEDPYHNRREVELIHNAIQASGRAMVLSLSPGPADVRYAAHLQQYANLWRITDDFWDSWPQLYDMFERCNTWAPYVKPGCWPDCDMLPVGLLRVNTPGQDTFKQYTNFTRDEQIAMMTLWCMFRSPLMVGAELRENDEFTLQLLTNPGVLALLKHSQGARQVLRTADAVVWACQGEDGSSYVALFNLGFARATPRVPLAALGLAGRYSLWDVWKNQPAGETDSAVAAEVAPHGAALYRLTHV